jgi:hypothetical protein
MPRLTGYLGPVIHISDHIKKSASRYIRYERLVRALAKKLPMSNWHITHCAPQFGPWQALSWHGFRQTTRYTYRINLESEIEELKYNLSAKTRNQITTQDSLLEIKEGLEPDLLYKWMQVAFKKKKTSVPFSRSFIQDYIDALASMNQLVMRVAYHNGRPVGAATAVYDSHTTYLILTGRDPDSPPGAMSRLIWEMINIAKRLDHKIFDFEGSMIESVADYFKSFGGELVPYHKVYQAKPRSLLSIMHLINRV